MVVLKLRLAVHLVAGLRHYWFRQLTRAANFGATMRVADEFKRDQAQALREKLEAEERLVRNVGLEGVDDDGRRLDEREFKETRNALRGLETAQMGWHRNQGGRYRPELIKMLEGRFERNGLPEDHGIILWVADDGQSWWAYRRTVTSWCFAVGATGPPPGQWLYDGPEPPTGPPGTDPVWGEQWGIDAKNW